MKIKDKIASWFRRPMYNPSGQWDKRIEPLYPDLVYAPKSYCCNEPILKMPNKDTGSTEDIGKCSRCKRPCNSNQ